MTISITNEAKNQAAITNEEKSLDNSLNDMDMAWQDNPDTFQNQTVVVSREAKNAVSISNEQK